MTLKDFFSRFASILLPGIMILTMIVGCGGKDPTVPSEEQIINTLHDATAMYNLIVEEHDEETARHETILWLQAQTNVREASLGPDQTTICYTYMDGTPASIITVPLESEVEGISGQSVIRSMSYSANMPGNQKAILLDTGAHMYENWFGKTLPRIRSMLNDLGYDCNYLNRGDVSLDNLRRLAEYGVIVYFGHGTYRTDDNGELVIGWVTGERAKDLNREDIRKARENGHIGVTSYSFFKDPLYLPRFSVFPSFFEQQDERYPDSMIFSYTCLGLYNDTLSDAFLSQGAAVFGGFTRVARPIVDHSSIRVVFDNLTNSRSIGEAFNAAGDSTLQFRPPAASEFRLVEVPMKILATPSGYDDIAQVLKGYLVEEISWNELADPASLEHCRALAINCADGLKSASNVVIDNIRNYVAGGGYLYASDFAYTIVDRGFPGMISFPYDPYIGKSGYVDASIDDAGLRSFMGLSNIQVFYDLGGWVPIYEVSPGVNILLSGTYQVNGNSITGPLAAAFRYDNGTVAYTSFHEKAQTDNLQGQLMEYIALLADADIQPPQPQSDHPFCIPTAGMLGFRHLQIGASGRPHPGIDIWTAMPDVNPPGNPIYLPYDGELIEIMTNARGSKQAIHFKHIIADTYKDLPAYEVYTVYVHMAVENDTPVSDDRIVELRSILGEQWVRDNISNKHIKAGASLICPELISEFDDKEGKRFFKRGTFLGLQGNQRWDHTSAESIITHLHFEVRSPGRAAIQANWIDPSPYLGLPLNAENSNSLEYGDVLPVDLVCH